MPIPQKIDPIKVCASCKAPLIRKRFQNGRLEDRTEFLRRIYCNQECMAIAFEGRIKVLTPRNSRRQSAKTVKSSCEICGRTGRLHVHHVDGNPMNNESGNLQTLCGSCHHLSHSPNYMGTPRLPKLCLHCSKPVARKGLCNTHLTRFKKFGDPFLKKFKIGSGWVLSRAAS